MNVSTFLIIVCVIVLLLAAALTRIIRRRRRHNRRLAVEEAAQQSARDKAEAERHAKLMANLNGLLDRIEADDAEAYDQLRQTYPGSKQYRSWSDLMRSNGLDSRKNKAVWDYETRRNYREWSESLRPLLENAQTESLPLTGRIAAAGKLTKELARLQRNNDYGAYYSISEELITKEAANQQLQVLINAHTPALAIQAAAGNHEAFDELNTLRALVREGEYKNFAKWTEVPDWHDLVGRYMEAPSLNDFGLAADDPGVPFVQRVVMTLNTGAWLDAKMLRAYIVADARLRDTLPGQLISAIYVFAATGERPQLDLLFATEPASDAL